MRPNHGFRIFGRLPPPPWIRPCARSVVIPSRRRTLNVEGHLERHSVLEGRPLIPDPGEAFRSAALPALQRRCLVSSSPLWWWWRPSGHRASGGGQNWVRSLSAVDDALGRWRGVIRRQQGTAVTARPSTPPSGRGWRGVSGSGAGGRAPGSVNRRRSSGWWRCWVGGLIVDRRPVARSAPPANVLVSNALLPSCRRDIVRLWRRLSSAMPHLCRFLAV